MASILAGRMSALRLAPASTSSPSSPSSSSSTTAARASAPAAPAQLATAPFNGAAAPSVSPLSLQVAEPDTASAVVHRYVVLLNQNARAVRFFEIDFFFFLLLDGKTKRNERKRNDVASSARELFVSQKHASRCFVCLSVAARNPQLR